MSQKLEGGNGGVLQKLILEGDFQTLISFTHSCESNETLVTEQSLIDASDEPKIGGWKRRGSSEIEIFGG